MERSPEGMRPELSKPLIMNVGRNAFYSLPLQVQEALDRASAPYVSSFRYGDSGYPVRYGPIFRQQYFSLQRSQWEDSESIHAKQLRQLRALLQHADSHVPFYRRMFQEHGFSPVDVESMTDLLALPYLTRALVRHNLDQMIADDVERSRLTMIATGGTSGNPLGFYADEAAFNPTEWAFLISMWRRVGYRFGDKSVVLRGNVPPTGSHCYDDVARQLILSSFHMTADTMQSYVDLAGKFSPKFILAYPSSAMVLARYMKENNLDPFPTVKALLLASETVYDFQRSLLEEVLQCRVFSWYGHTERAVLGGECEHSHYYHLFPEYGITEIVDKSGQPVEREDEIGEIVATGFLNWAMPFIRYETGDMGAYSSKRCACGRNYPLLTRVEGRIDEYIVAADGSLIPLGPAIFAIHDAKFAAVKQIQFVQEKPGELIINAAREAYTSDEEIVQYLLTTFNRKLGALFRLSVNVVEEIPRTSRGKHRYLIQKIPIGI